MRTFDTHDKADPVKPILADNKIFLVIIFLYMLSEEILFVSKSRQMRVSWAAAAFNTWAARTGSFRHNVYQTKKDEDAQDMVSKGNKNPGSGRMDFIEQNLPGWLRDPNIAGGAGNMVGKLIYTPTVKDSVTKFRVLWQGSKTESVPQGADQVRGKTIFLYTGDEVAFQDEWAEVLKAVMPAVAGGGRCLAVSTSNASSHFNQAVTQTPDGSLPDPNNWDPEPYVPHAVQVALDALGLDGLPEGIRSWKTPAGAVVLEVHYTADPDKNPSTARGRDWVKNAVQRPPYYGSFTSSAWRQEMEIDYWAGGGDPVFPFLIDPTHAVFTPLPRHLDLYKDPQRVFYAGYDYGTRNPAAFVVWCIHPDGRREAVWELYEPCKNLALHAAKIKKCPYFDRLEFIKADPDIFAKKQAQATGLKAVSDLFVEHGIHMIPARKGADVPVALRFLSDFWADTANPQAQISAACPNGMREVRELKWDEHRTEAVRQYRNNPEKIRDKNNHWWDASSYAHDILVDGAPVAREQNRAVWGTMAWAEKIIEQTDRASKKGREYVGA